MMLPENTPRHDERPDGWHAGCDCGTVAPPADPWRRGFTRRRFLAGTTVLAAALGVQPVTTRFAFAAAPAGPVDTLVVLSLRGGFDGLSAVVPAFDRAYYDARPNTGIGEGALLPLDRGFGLHPALAPLKPYFDDRRLAVVHAVGSPDRTRSHFEAQDTIERGAADRGVGDGWLNRLLQDRSERGVFTAVQVGSAVPASLMGPAPALAMDGVDTFGLGGFDGVRAETARAFRKLYARYDHPMARQALDTLTTLDTVEALKEQAYESATAYPDGGLAGALKQVARLIKADLGMTVATVDHGGWDHHTGGGTVDGGQLRDYLTELAAALAAFFTDLGEALDRTVVVTVSEFGRTVRENANLGWDHGHGNAMLLAGGGIRGGQVYGRWPGLGEDDIDDNALAGTTDYRSVLAEVLMRRGGAGSMAKVFPGFRPKLLGFAQART